MSEPYIWNGLAKANNDPTTIDQAIAAAVTVHNDDPDAHLGDDQALQSHRAAEIIDHLAESVVNDKIEPRARAYVAIVGSGLPGDYTSLEAAIAYALGTKGGTILLMPGTYYVSAGILIEPKINILGVDVESCIIEYSGTGMLFVYQDDADTGQKQAIIENVTINMSAGSYVLMPYTLANTYQKEWIFRNCRITTLGYFSRQADDIIRFYECTITAYGSYFTSGSTELIFYDSTLNWSNNSTSSVFQKYYSSSTELRYLSIIRTTFTVSTYGTTGLMNGTTGVIREIRDSRVYTLDLKQAGQSPRQVYNSDVTLSATTQLTVGVIAGDCVYSNTVFSGGIIPNLVAGTSPGFIFGCSYSGDPRVSGRPLELTESTGVPEKYTQPSAQTQVRAWQGKEISYTPTANVTLTAAGGVAGQQRIIRILSTTTSYTITFGAGFKGSATLATGTTASRQFIVVFTCGGSYWWETARTTAQTL